MSHLYYLSGPQLERLKPYFPMSHGKPRVDDRRVLSGIIHVIRNGLRWCDAPLAYGPYKTLYNRFIRWSRMGVFDRIFTDLAASAGVPVQLQIDAPISKLTERQPACLKRGCSPPYRAHQGWIKFQIARHL